MKNTRDSLDRRITEQKLLVAINEALLEHYIDEKRKREEENLDVKKRESSPTKLGTPSALPKPGA